MEIVLIDQCDLKVTLSELFGQGKAGETCSNNYDSLRHGEWSMVNIRDRRHVAGTAQESLHLYSLKTCHHDL